MLFTSAPTNGFVSHSHIPGGPATEAAGQVVSLLHGRLGGIVRQRRWDVGGSGRQRVHATRAVKTICTPAEQYSTHNQEWILITFISII